MKKLLIFLLLSCLPLFLNAQGLVVQTTHGKVEGIQEDGGIISFKGIPFAAPPVGELRWQPPQPVIPWEGIRKCEAFGPSPVQGKPAPFLFWSSEFLIPEEPISEDCLYLNVWTNGTGSNDKKAVLVYIYGGGFQSGGTACPIYDGTAMAGKDVVFVSMNYRVGKFGFLAHPELTRETDNKASGNYALMDMIAALSWVKNNISAFGGDPSNVTIAGQSAGAFAVNYLTASPLAKGLFHKAIAQSGGAYYARAGRETLNLEQAEKQGVALGEELGAATIEELRKLPAEEILKAKSGTSWPIVDGHVMERSVYEVYWNDMQADIPLIVGWNADDRVFVNPSADFTAALQERFGEQAAGFLSVYPHGTEKEARASQMKMGRDETFALQGFAWAGFHGAKRGRDVFVYNFNRALPAYDEKSAFGAFHSGEIVYAYDNLHTLDRPWEDTDRELARQMSAYWANFARTGNPNGEDLPLWEPFDTKSKMVLVLDEDVTSKPLPDAEQLQQWQEYYEGRIKK